MNVNYSLPGVPSTRVYQSCLSQKAQAGLARLGSETKSKSELGSAWPRTSFQFPNGARNEQGRSREGAKKELEGSGEGAWRDLLAKYFSFLSVLTAPSLGRSGTPCSSPSFLHSTTWCSAVQCKAAQFDMTTLIHVATNK